MYNLTIIGKNASSGLLGFMQGVNDILMFGWLGTAILICIFLVTLIAFYSTTADLRKALVGSSFIMFAFSILLRAMSLMTDSMMFICMILAAIIIAFSFISGE